MKKKITVLLLAVLMLATFSNAAFADSILDDETGGPVITDPRTDPGWVLEDVPYTPSAQLHPFPIAFQRAIDSVTVIKGSALFAESGVGAHYYAFSSKSTAYTEAYTNIKLPTRLNTTSGTGKRRAFICLGLQGNLSGIDLGLANDGSGWQPYYYDGCDKTYAFYPAFTASSAVTNAVMTIKPVSTSQVDFYIRYTDANDNTIGDTFWQRLTIVDGNLEMSGGRINCKFFRFASLVPIKIPDDQMDSSYMLGGQFTGCQLYNGSSYVSWGIGNSMMTNVWKVSPERMTLTYSGTTDSFGIDHWST